jgi:predicted DCC family thiol-disulfide oxidoreductase YuxK
MLPSPAHPVLLYDGVCGLCNHLVEYVLKNDRKDVFRFASLQSEVAGRILRRHDRHPASLDTLYIVVGFEESGERLLSRSEAVSYVLEQLGGAKLLIARLFRLLPLAIRDFLYNSVARHRYRMFGKHESCPIPDPQTRSKFIDL